jgi:glycosyltransferase involved in cell wall biosynthesis
VLGRIPDFAAALAQCDLIVWPSNAKTYRGNTSGIVSESVASGIPLVMSSNCAPAERVVEIGSATFFHHFSVGAVMQAINEAVANYPALVAAARYGAELWRQREGTVRLARVVAEGS